MSLEDKDVEELLKIAKSTPNQNIPVYDVDNEVYRFAVACNIRKGKDKIQAATVYEKYLKWKNSKDVMSVQLFFRYFKLFFDSKRDGRGRFYFLDRDTFYGIAKGGEDDSKETTTSEEKTKKETR